MSKQLSLKESFEGVNKKRRYSNEGMMCSASSSPLTSLPLISSSATTLTFTTLALTSTPSSSQVELSTSEPITPPMLLLSTAVSLPSTSENSQLSIVDEDDHVLCLSPKNSSKTIVAAASLVDMYDPSYASSIREVEVYISSALVKKTRRKYFFDELEFFHKRPPPLKKFLCTPLVQMIIRNILLNRFNVQIVQISINTRDLSFRMRMRTKVYEREIFFVIFHN